MTASRVVVLLLVVLVPLTACLVLAAAGDVGVPHPWSKPARSAGHGAVRLPSAIAATPAALTPLPFVGRLVALSSPPTAFIAPRPPFVPPRV